MTRFIGLAGVALVAAGCTQAAAIEEVRRPVRVAAAAAAVNERGARYSAEITPAEQVVLAFKNSGYVDGLLETKDVTGRRRDVERGDRVAAGTVLARIQPSDYQARVTRATAAVSQADAALVKARADFQRAQTLFGVDALTRPDLDAARAAHDSAVAQHAGAQAELSMANLALADVALKTPRAAVVLERNVERGALVTAGSPGFVLGTVNPVKAVFGVPDSTVQHLKVGAPLTLTTDAVASHAFTGRITTVSPAADPETRLFMVEVAIPNDQYELRPGMIASVEMTDPAASPDTSNTPAVPLTAVVKNDASATGYGVFVYEPSNGGGVARFKSVTLGSLAGNTVHILDGIRLGERVVVSAPNQLKDGEAVALVP
jgi:RND family efflux transporter MFP subunit